MGLCLISGKSLLGCLASIVSELMRLSLSSSDRLMDRASSEGVLPLRPDCSLKDPKGVLTGMCMAESLAPPPADLLLLRQLALLKEELPGAWRASARSSRCADVSPRCADASPSSDCFAAPLPARGGGLRCCLRLAASEGFSSERVWSFFGLSTPVSTSALRTCAVQLFCCSR